MDGRTLVRQRLRIALHTAVLVAALATVPALAGWLIAGAGGVLWMAGLALVAVTVAPRLSARLLTRRFGARPIAPYEAPGLYRMVETLARRAGLDHVPALYSLPVPVMQAMSVGSPDDATVVVTDGLLQDLDDRELAGVLAHEVAHIRNRDTSLMALAEVAHRLTRALSSFAILFAVLMAPLVLLGAVAISPLALLVLAVAPNVAFLLQLALSRTREFDADATAARLTGDPLALASALARLERRQRHPLARLLGLPTGDPTPLWLRTHPATEERIRRLAALAPPGSAPSRRPAPPPSRPPLPWWI